MTTWVPGCDFSYSKPDLRKLWDAGYRVILGYLSDTPGKGLTAAYIAEALAIGFRIVPLYETTARAALGGRLAGITQATTAMRIGDALGMPAGTTVIFALDSDYTTAEMATVSAFVSGLHAVAGPVGEYGGINQLRYLLAHNIADSGRLFQTYAWSSGQWLDTVYAPIQQYRNGITVAGGVVDECRVDLDNPAITFWEAPMAHDALDATDVHDIWFTQLIPDQDADVTKYPTLTPATALVRIWEHVNEVSAAQASLTAKLAGLPAAIVAGLPPAAAGGLTEADVEQAVHAGLAKLGIAVTVAS